MCNSITLYLEDITQIIAPKGNAWIIPEAKKRDQ
jgi:hypothetical protein